MGVILQGHNLNSSYYLVSSVANLKSGFVMMGRKLFSSNFSSESACHELC